MLAQERLYLTEKRDRVVREGDARSAFLYAVPGDEIPQSAADKFGLVDGRLPDKSAPKAATKPKPETKDKPPTENKEKGGQDKGQPAGGGAAP